MTELLVQVDDPGVARGVRDGALGGLLGGPVRGPGALGRGLAGGTGSGDVRADAVGAAGGGRYGSAGDRLAVLHLGLGQERGALRLGQQPVVLGGQGTGALLGGAAQVLLDVRRGVVPQQVLHEGDLGGVLGPPGGAQPGLDLLAHGVPGLEYLERVEVPQPVEEDHRGGEPDVERVVGAVVLTGHQGDGAGHDADAVEDVVEPGAEDRALAGEPGDLAVHAVQDETDVVDDGADDQPLPVTLKEAARRDESEQQCAPGDLVRCDPRPLRDQPHEGCGDRVDEEDGPPRVPLLLDETAHLGEVGHVPVFRWHGPTPWLSIGVHPTLRTLLPRVQDLVSTTFRGG